MNRVMLGLAALVWFVSQGTQAAVISRDWKMPGDGLLTYDTINKREWLDLTESRLATFAGSSFEQRFQNGLLELGSGGQFEGFEAASSLDLTAFFQSAGIVPFGSFAINGTATGDLIDLVGASISSTIYPGNQVAFGLLNELSGPSDFRPNTRLTGELFYLPESGSLGDAGFLIGAGAGDTLPTSSNTGIWLYRPVPELNGLSLAIIAFAIAVSFWSFRRRTHTANRNSNGRATRLRGRRYSLELLEERSLLSASADIVFLVDESGSTGISDPTQSWVRSSLVPQLESSGFNANLASKGVTDIEYGLIGFGGGPSSVTDSEFANSFVLGTQRGHSTF